MQRTPTSLFDYDLPPELIAQHPAGKRDGSRMLVLHRDSGTLEHLRFGDLPDLLHPGDLLVANDTRVIPVRFVGRKQGTGGRVEFLLLEETAPGEWDTLLKSSRRPPPGSVIDLFEGRASATVLSLGDRGRARVRFDSDTPWTDLLTRFGQMPLPPYIHREEGPQSPEDLERYQTVYARESGAVAAPTAGLHFTPEVFNRLEARGIERTMVTLHVGIGTFRPVVVDDVEAHRMDEERYQVSGEVVQSIERTRARKGRVVAVGSTAVRSLESAARSGTLQASSGRTDLFIHPPYTFNVVDAMLTNFHLPCSTLLMMVSALAGREKVLEAYRCAVEHKYRFFSYGDCMLIL